MDQIIIEIRGGVANVVKKSAGVELIIKDFDCNEYKDGEPDADHGKDYMEEIYESETSWDETNFLDEIDPN